MRNRKPLPFKTNPTFAIIVDGDCEIWYFQMLKRNERSITVNIEPKIPQKKKLSEQYENVFNLAKDYTKVFWIVDFDVISSETKKAKKGNKTALQEFSEYRKLVLEKHDNVIVIVNNPCLEYWLLLHFEETSKLFSTCADAEKQLKKHLKDYEKTQKYYTKENHDIYLKLKPNLKTAIKNAKKLDPFEKGNPDRGISEMQWLFEAVELKEITK